MEALVYAALLRCPGVTAYRIAKLIGKSQANVALALSGLVKKRAVVADSEAPVTFEPVSVAALMGQLKTDFGQKIESASTVLDSIQVETQQDRIRRLVSAEDVHVQARAMLAAAKETVLFNATDGPLAELAADLSAASARAAVVGLTLSGGELAGVRILRSRRGEELKATLDGEVLILITDAREMLIAFFEKDGVTLRQAIWANNSLLVGLFHNGIVSDVILHSSPTIDSIKSPNEYLFDCIPSAIREVFFAGE
jgi:sugar-specific transcriptional regulator TrmB